ncbi:ABC transporter ATP-binding protein [Sphingobacterium lumbrici]|uniref:ABC transporter ATP-binding protein n=1 Tax=Sphingobacterium lumbrici TaxID=2559600 RepID=UPI00112C8FAE|nr:ABC transporter ATP-binding protein [Sphingobacterium lumbrici]
MKEKWKNTKSFFADKFKTLYYFYKYLGNKIFILLFFNFLMVLMDGLGLTMFVPLLQIADGANNATGGNEKLINGVQQAFDFIGAELNVLNMLILIVTIFVLKALFVYFTLKYQAIALQSIAKAIRANLSYGVRDLSYKEFVHTDVGRLQNSLTGESHQVAAACSQYLDTIKNGMIVTVYLGFAFFLDWKFSILIVLGGILTNFIYKLFYTRTKNLSRAITKNNHRYGGIVIETVNHFKYLKASGRNRAFVSRMINELNDLIQNNIRVGKLNARLTAMREPMMIIIICIVIALHLLVFQSTLSAVLIILVMFYRAMTYIMALQTAWNGFLANTGALENIQDFEHYLNTHKENFIGEEHLPRIDQIQLRDISLSYGDFKVLNNIDLDILRNHSIALVGESGSGKTTLVNLICSLLPYDVGTFRINGSDMKAFHNTDFRDKVGYITQEPTIFNADIFDNVTFWSERTAENLEKFWQVIGMCSLLKFVEGLPKQEREILGNNGLNVSGGQKQRISIARELFRDVELLIMDEATSALDSETEKEIKESMEALQGKVTLISIAHRLSTIRNADRIYLMDKGQIVASGNFEELKQKSDYFTKLAELQGL